MAASQVGSVRYSRVQSVGGGVPSKLCTPRSGGTDSVAAAADPMGAVGAESVGRAGLSLEGERSQGRRGSRAVATGALGGGGPESGRSRP